MYGHGFEVEETEEEGSTELKWTVSCELTVMESGVDDGVFVLLNGVCGGRSVATFSMQTEFLGGEGKVCVDDKVGKGLWDMDRREEKVHVVEDTLGGVVLGGNLFEDTIDFRVAAASVPPSFNNTGVVTMNNDMGSHIEENRESADEELKSDGFGPGNVSVALESFPSRDESPGSPAVANCDSDSKARTGI
ncbi:hypothetical protein PAXRUDRAFT_13982 [Paxillus rubicundulus Ve08.2h10]|uniref:Uncharacterized protein n=1 Tax=Paxillus rubicundulus Ve08.2h10 TaxID=930991 RepID=A0A0D0E2L9_9AGAM|nr:hypothetical protein PAXRUDRAFT_13982 [Paxillus rubicundulus Ve08.2h10]